MVSLVEVECPGCGASVAVIEGGGTDTVRCDECDVTFTYTDGSVSETAAEAPTVSQAAQRNIVELAVALVEHWESQGSLSLESLDRARQRDTPHGRLFIAVKALKEAE